MLAGLNNKREGKAKDNSVRSERWACMMQGKTFAGWLARTFPAYRDRLIEDRRFFFKVWPDSPHLKKHNSRSQCTRSVSYPITQSIA